jgi:hypothetical protein
MSSRVTTSRYTPQNEEIDEKWVNRAKVVVVAMNITTPPELNRFLVVIGIQT